MNDVIYQNYTSKGLRVIALAYKDINSMGFMQLKKECNNF